VVRGSAERAIRRGAARNMVCWERKGKRNKEMRNVVADGGVVLGAVTYGFGVVLDF
jgi:hypothetical protein